MRPTHSARFDGGPAWGWSTRSGSGSGHGIGMTSAAIPKLLAHHPLLRFSLDDDGRGSAKPEPIQHAFAPPRQARQRGIAVGVRRRREYEPAAEQPAPQAHLPGHALGGVVVVDVRVRAAKRSNQTGPARKHEPQARQALVLAADRQEANAVHHRLGLVAFAPGDEIDGVATRDQPLCEKLVWCSTPPM